MSEPSGKPKKTGRGGASLKYRAPLPAYYFFAGMMILLTALALSQPTADLADIEPSPSVESIMRAKARDPNQPFSPSLFFYHMVNAFYHLSRQLHLPFLGVQGIAVAAWIAHFAEAYYSWTLCRKGRASLATTCMYVTMTFIGGFGQLVTLKKALHAVGV